MACLGKPRAQERWLIQGQEDLKWRETGIQTTYTKAAEHEGLTTRWSEKEIAHSKQIVSKSSLLRFRA